VAAVICAARLLLNWPLTLSPSSIVGKTAITCHHIYVNSAASAVAVGIRDPARRVYCPNHALVRKLFALVL
jgi:hypothetical protein